MRWRRRSRPRSTSRRSASGSHRASTRPAGSAGPRRRSSCCSTEDPAEATRLAEELETLNRERQAVEERILARRSTRSSRGRRAAPRRKGYVVAGADWHEGVIGIVASRLVERYNRPVVADRGHRRRLEGLGAVGPAPSTCTPGSRACAGHLERFGGHRAAAGLVDQPEQVETFAAAFGGARRLACSPTTISSPVDARRRDRARAEARARPLRGAAAARAVRARQSRRAAARRRLRARRPVARSATASTCASASASAVATPARAIAFGMGAAARPLPPRAALRRRVPPAGEPLERRRRRRSSSSGGLRRSRRRSRSCATGSRLSGGPGRPRGRPRHGRSSPSSSSPTARSGACSSRRRSGRCSTRRPRWLRQPESYGRASASSSRSIRAMRRQSLGVPAAAEHG